MPAGVAALIPIDIATFSDAAIVAPAQVVPAPPILFEHSISADIMLTAPAPAASDAVSFAEAIADPIVQIFVFPMPELADQPSVDWEFIDVELTEEI